MASKHTSTPIHSSWGGTESGEVNYGAFVVFPERESPGRGGSRTETAGKTVHKVVEKGPGAVPAPENPGRRETSAGPAPRNPTPENPGQPETAGDPVAHDPAPENPGQPEATPPEPAAAVDQDSFIDPNSGIPEDEQREILVQINGIHQRNRDALSSGKGPRGRFKARKNGGLFPVLVNAFALAMLAGGLFVIYSLQTEADVSAREGTRVFNSMERALIYEIRRETNALLETTDDEIAILTALLNAVETQLRELLAPGEILTQEQLVTEERLVTDRDYYRERIAFLRGERSRILDESRSQELMLQAQRETRIQEALLQEQLEAAAREATFLGEIEALAQELMRQERVRDLERYLPGEAEWTRTELDAAREELARLARDQARGARVNDQVAAFLETAHRQISERSFAEAELTVEGMREFLYARGSYAAQGRDLYLLAANSLRTLLDENRQAHQALNAAHEALANETPAVVAQQEAYALPQAQDLAHPEPYAPPPQAAPALIAEPPDAAHYARLQQEIARLELELAARDRIMDPAAADSAQIAAHLQQSENAMLNSQISALQSTNATLNSQVSALQSTNATLNSQANALQSTNATLNSQANALQSTNATLNSQLGLMQSTNATLNSANANLNSQVENLQASLSAQTRIAESMRQEASSLRTANTSLTNQLTHLRQALLNQ